ncbi:MAG: O-antigen ligase family protein [Candidatus Acidiferrales bacterium]
MPPTLALVLWFVLLVALLYFDPAKDEKTSLALWVPMTWMFFNESRLPSQWLSGPIGAWGTGTVDDGNPMDRVVFFGLILIAILILIFRSVRWSDFVVRNFALVAYLAFALISVSWSDFPFVSFKRWFRDLGDYMMILVVLSDPRCSEAMRTVLRRLYYFLISLSVLLLKYYPERSRFFDPWTGIAENSGVGTSKNMLGSLCMLSGIFFFWDFVTRFSKRKEKQTKRILLVDAAFIAMILWLLNLSSSETSHVCLAIGCAVVAIVSSKWGRRHPVFLKLMIPAFFAFYLILAYGFGLQGEMTHQLGRNADLTGRTNIWNAVLSVHTNPLVGTGYETFWLGPRRDIVGQLSGQTQEAHNGYIEVYINLGIMGLIFMGGVLISTYRKLCASLNQYSSLVALAWGLSSITLFYNMTEAAFKASFMCLTFLWGTIVVTRGTTVGGVSAKEPSFEGSASKKWEIAR